MKPLGDRAHEGRVNPKGIPCLYHASTRKAAISEMRPGISDFLSVARFKTLRDLKIMNFNKKHGSLVGLFPPPEGINIDDTVWATIDKRPSRNPSSGLKIERITPPHKLSLNY